MLNIYIASDHAGFALKKKLMERLRNMGHEVKDFGAYEFDPEDDYPDFVTPCAKAVVADPGSLGVILGASGQGEAMCANRVPGVRAAVLWGGALALVALAREHNDANILSIGASFIAPDDAEKAVETFVSTPFSGSERHVRRIAKF
jgi:ribose 5-phosphate isomerase B